VLPALGDYADAAAAELLTARTFDAHPTGVADLCGLRLAVLHESDAGRRLAEGTVKRLTGADRLKARRMREDFWSFDPSHTFVMLTNHRPVLTGTDEGIWRRLRLVPWDIVIPPEERDEELPDRLALERDAVLAWLVAGYRDWRQRGLADPGKVTDATAASRAALQNRDLRPLRYRADRAAPARHVQRLPALRRRGRGPLHALVCRPRHGQHPQAPGHVVPQRRDHPDARGQRPHARAPGRAGVATMTGERDPLTGRLRYPVGVSIHLADKTMPSSSLRGAGMRPSATSPAGTSGRSGTASSSSRSPAARRPPMGEADRATRLGRHLDC